MSERSGSSGSRWAVAAAAALLLAGAVWTGYRWISRNPSNIQALVRATGERRLAEGRLTGGFAWAPVMASRGTDGSRASTERLEIAATAARIEGGRGPTGDAHALGVAHLLLGNLDDAISSLENAAEDHEDPSVLSDLAAALIERGKRPDQAQDLVRALDLAERALTKAANQPELWFNRAIALEALHLREASIAAWQRYLEVDVDSAWAQEAQERLERSTKGPLSIPWEEDAFLQACSACNRAVVERFVRDHPQQATEAILSKLLPAWVERSTAGDKEDADRAVARFRCGGAAIAAVVGDSFLLDVAEEIRSLERRPNELLRFVDSCRQFVTGRRLLDELDASHARPLLAQATRGLSVTKSKLRYAAELSRLSSEHYLGSVVQADLLTLQREAEAASCRIVAAQAAWLRGLELSVRGRPGEAIAVLDRARAGLEQLGFTADATFVRSILASTWTDLGRTSRAWREFSQVLAELDGISDPRRAQSAVTAAAAEAQVEGYQFAAVTLQEAALEFARRHTSLVDACDGSVWLAELAARAGKVSLATRALEDAERVVRQLSDPEVQAYLGAEIALVHATLLSERDPNRAGHEADRAISYFQRVKAAPRLVGAHVTRAKASKALRDEADTEAHYHAAMQALEEQREAIDDATLRVSFFDNSFHLAREVVAHEWSRGKIDSALHSADLIRARTLLETRGVSSKHTEPPDILRRQLGPADAVLFYSVLPDKTILWVLRRDSIHGAEVGWDERELRRRVMAWRHAVLDRQRERAEEEAARLFDGLVKPGASHLQGATRIVIVPDGLLHRIAWASLRVAESGRLWIEDVSVVVAPCLTAACGNATPASLRTVVAVGNPAFDRELFPELGDLPEASQESREVAGCYPQAQLLLGVAATPDRVLQAAEHTDVLHVAAHAVADGADAERSTLVLARGGEISPGGVLLPRHVRARDLRALHLVVLAACRSGDGPLSEAEGPLSLARSFLEAGAGSVVVSLFDFPDRGSTAVDIHRHVRDGLDPVEAFRRSVRDCWAAASPDPLACGSLQLIVNQRGE